jgi:hypothetical protein
VYIYALSYRNPYSPSELFALFLAADRLLTNDEAMGRAVEQIREDNLGHEWVEAVAQGALCGPLQIDGRLSQPTIAVTVE